MAFEERRNDVLDAVDDAEEAADRGAGEAAVADIADELEQLVPIAADIDDEDRLVVQAELLPGDHLEGLVERAEPARQNREGVRHLEHAALALVHRADDEKLANAAMPDLLVVKMRRNDAGDPAAAGDH